MDLASEMPKTRVDLSPSERRRGVIFLALTVGLLMLSLQIQMSVNHNFVVDEMQLEAYQQGVLEGLRESCGILALAVLAILAAVSEPIVGMFMLMLFGIGLGAYAFVPNYGTLIAASMTWSIGFHVWIPIPNSMALALADPGQAGRRLGQIRSAGAVGAGVGLVGALILNRCNVNIRTLFLIAGVVAIAAAVCCAMIPRNIKVPGQRFVFRKAYWRFYLLQFLEGWRKQIFVAFAGFLLVKRYNTTLETMLIMGLTVKAISWITSPLIGRVIDKIGERKVLATYYSALTTCFIGYAVITDPNALYILYVIDHSLFAFAMALTTYVNRIAPPEDHTPTLSMGVAFNHIAATLTPVVGGLLWKTMGYNWVFWLGAIVGVISAGVSLVIPKHVPESTSRR